MMLVSVMPVGVADTPAYMTQAQRTHCRLLLLAETLLPAAGQQEIPLPHQPAADLHTYEGGLGLKPLFTASVI